MADGRILRGGAAGALAAAVWAGQEPLDVAMFGAPYSPPKLPAKPIGGPRAAVIPIHLANGAALGAIYSLVASRLPGPAVARGAAIGMAEHLATWPLVRFLPGVNLWGNHRAFAQAVWRHVLFGAILGVAYERLSEGYAGDAPA